MMRRIFLAAVWLSVILVSCKHAALAQTNSSATSQDTTNPPIDVMYTGKLLGYFRLPSLQDFTSTTGCTTRSDNPSKAAKFFLEKRPANAILVGTGDNFAPQLEARVFSNPPPSHGPGLYAVGNKELYFGHGNNWLFYERLKDPAYKKFRQDLADGLGSIPNDNVACFLRAAQFAAIVPGKHDFYFGADRVRQFARFLATPAPANSDFKAVQMLGANLVIKTVPIESKRLAARFTQPQSFKEWPARLKVLNLTDGKTVYPWFSYVKIELVNLQADEPGVEVVKRQFDSVGSLARLVGIIGAEKPGEEELNKLRRNAHELNSKAISICSSNGGPNDIDFNRCDQLIKEEVRFEGNAVTLVLKLPSKVTTSSEHFSTLIPGQNYGLCFDNKNPATKDDNECMRFSSYRPFFYHPHDVPNPQQNPATYTDPEPYVQEENFAIFGVVDPNLGEQVGILNFGWQNEQTDLTTRVSVEDPAEALRQQLEYFKRRNRERGIRFTGLKILLAQMSPQRARALAATFREFQIVVSAADQDQATSEVDMTTVWNPTEHSAGAFLAVPAPYFDSSRRSGDVHSGFVKAQKRDDGSWDLRAHKLDPRTVEEPPDPANRFWSAIKSLPGCLPSSPPQGNATNQTYLKWLVLCTIREHMAADVALIQTRDLFDKIPKLDDPGERLLDRANVPPTQLPSAANRVENFQQLLDRLIWKGDLVTLLYVPGSALKKALQQSDQFEAEERATLSLSVDKGRKLEMLGVRKDKGEYFVNELPLDEKKIYSVATTDYLGAGDTGYPDLVKSALNPRSHPAAFTGKLESISSLVCRKLFADPTQRDLYCLSPVNASQYLDASSAKQTPPYKQPGVLSAFWDSLEFEWPKSATDSKTLPGAIEEKVQRRGFWKYSLRNFSFGFKSVNNNHTDAEIRQKFGGIPTSGVAAQESRAFSTSLDTRLSYSAHKREFFISSGIAFEKLSTGDTPTAFTVSQIKNRLFGDSGFVFWRRPGRGLPNFGLSLSVHAETQLQRPFSIFTLATPEGDQLRLNQDRSLLFLPRFGLRWQNRTNAAEVGVQAGREFRAFRGYRFETDGVVVECLADSKVTFRKCITDNSKPPNGGITPDSVVTSLAQDRPRAGVYWKTTLSIPFTSKVKYELEQEADFFFVNFHQDTTVDTRFRDISKHRLSFVIWPSFSIGPTLDLLLYQNMVNKDFLFQRQFGIETKLSFDIFNRREKGVQVQNKP